MKRKFMMLGFAMLSGLSSAVCAKGFGKEERMASHASWNTTYSTHYGKEGADHPLMDHLSVNIPRTAESSWKMQLSPPTIDQAGMDSPVHGRDKRLGISFKLEF